MLTREGLMEIFSLTSDSFIPSPLATKEELLTTHCPIYVDHVFNGTLDDRAQKRIGFPWSKELVKRVRASTGGTLAAARVALETGYGAQLAGGTHHAHYDFGSGYCVFNDFAVAINVLRAEQKIKRAAIIDLDVHQGDGNAALLADNPDVLVFSMHGAKNFPSRKHPSDIDIELADGCDDNGYLSQLALVLPHIEQFMPEIIFYQAGVDVLATDRLGRLALTTKGLAQRDHQVFSMAQRMRVPIVQVLGGGYGEPLSTTIEGYLTTFQVARQYYPTPY
ncbi:MAG: histone deacetylase [Pseudomonadales bacterium]|nr:histone deacetylase [Pseudomonadales bacterium]